MAEIIDLTIDELIVNPNTDTITATVPVARRQRAPPKCGYCGIQGHTIRSCNDPETMNTVRELKQRVGRFPPFQEIIDWLQTIDVRRLQFILSKYTYSKYKKCSKEMCIDILSVTISDKYRREESRARQLFRSVLHNNVVMLWAQEHQNIPLQYMQYCEQFIAPLPTEEECQLLCDIIRSRNIPQTTPYHTITRFRNFIIYIYNRNVNRLQPQQQQPQQNNSIKYVITRKTINEPIEIDCPICMDTKKTPSILTTTCGHQFCWDCINRVLNKQTASRCVCPLCRTPIYKLIQENI
jgi:hypothetical protein